MTLIGITGFASISIVALSLGLACRAQRREIERLRGDVATFSAAYLMHDQLRCDQQAMKARFRDTLKAIADATRNGKSGTAKKVHRMAMEGLNHEQA